MRAKLTVAVACVGLLLAVRPLIAHHSFAAEFDAENPVQLRGVVTGMDWVNPHSWIHLDVKNEDGTVTKWMVEGATPNTLLRRGFTKSLAAGRHRDRRLRLPREERRQPRQRPRRDAAGRQASVPRLVGNRRAGGRQRFLGEVDRSRTAASIQNGRPMPAGLASSSQPADHWTTIKPGPPATSWSPPRRGAGPPSLSVSCVLLCPSCRSSWAGGWRA